MAAGPSLSGGREPEVCRPTVAFNHLRDADSVPVPRRGRLEPEPHAQRLGGPRPKGCSSKISAFRTVPESLWLAVRERFRDTRASYLRATNG